MGQVWRIQPFTDDLLPIGRNVFVFSIFCLNIFIESKNRENVDDGKVYFDFRHPQRSIDGLNFFHMTPFELILVGWLVGFYGISTFVGYLTPNPFLYRFQTIQFSMSIQFN